MAAVAAETKPIDAVPEETCLSKLAASKLGDGLRPYYLQHIHELQLQVRQKTHNLNRLEAQRNELNSRGEALIPIGNSIFRIPNPSNWLLVIGISIGLVRVCSDWYWVLNLG